MFLYTIFFIYPLPDVPGLVFMYIALKGFWKYALINVTFLMQFLSELGGTLPIDNPTPSLTVTFSTSICSVQLQLVPPWLGLGTTTSS